MDKIKNLLNLNNFKKIFMNLDKTDLKIMKRGLTFCFIITLFSVFLLSLYLFFTKNLFLYTFGLMIFKISTYIAVEFVICGIIVDAIKKYNF